MIAIRPITEQAVLDSLGAPRYGADVEGYVVMDGPSYKGYALYRVCGSVTEVLECAVQDTALVDGAVRACVAAGEDAGASRFALRLEDPVLARWGQVFVKSGAFPAANTEIFHKCQ